MDMSDANAADQPLPPARALRRAWGRAEAHDSQAPAVVAIDPSYYATGVAVGADIVVTFSEAILAGDGNITVRDDTGQVVLQERAAGSTRIRISGAELRFDPAQDFSQGTTLRLEFGAGLVTDLEGNSFYGMYGYEFTTAYSPVPVNLAGTPGPDRLHGSESNDTIWGGAGGDYLFGHAGDDRLDGGDERAEGEGDMLDGGPGSDTLNGNAGSDYLNGGEGNDTLNGGAGNDYIVDNGGDDLLEGGDGDDALTDTSGRNILRGGNGNDTLQPGAGTINELDGGPGDDRLFGSDRDSFIGGEGNDRIFITLSDPVAHVVSASGGAGDDVFETYFLPASASTLNLSGGAGSDTYVLNLPYAANHYTIGDFGAGSAGDQIDLTALLGRTNWSQGNPFNAQAAMRLQQDGADTLLQLHAGSADGGADYQTLLRLGGIAPGMLGPANFVGGINPNGSPDGVTLTGTAQDERLSGFMLDDRLFGLGGADLLNGGPGNDHIEGGDEAPGTGDTLLGEEGDDTLLGGAGDDFLDGGDGNDTLDGGDGNDHLRGRGGDNTLAGGAGDDTLVGDGSGINRLDGGAGSDELHGAAGNDELLGGSGDDYLSGDDGDDLLDGGDGADAIYDSGGSNRLLGGAGNDTLSVRGAGSNTLFGGDGNDMFSGGSGNDAIDGGAGMDWANYHGAMASYTLTPGADGLGVADRRGDDGSDTLTGVERIRFADSAFALDIYGAGGQSYRVYHAAFDRTPDLAGLGFWISVMDGGASVAQVAQAFVQSAEFSAMYGASASNAELVERIYRHVLERAPDAGGAAFWTEALDSGRASTGEVLATFSESAENQAALIGQIGNGFAYTYYQG